MANRRSHKHVAALKKTRRYRDQVQKTQRKMHLEQLEDRRVMATTGPTLVNVLTNNGPLGMTQNQTLNVAPREITLRFAEGQRIDPTTLATGIVITRTNLDNTFANGNDVTVTPGYVGLADTPREVIIRFQENLPDDLYRIQLVGTGLTPLKDVFGNAVNGGVDLTYDFNLDLGAQIIAIVPQPITRAANGSLTQSLNTIDVYFNPDPLKPESVQNPAFYKLLDTTTGEVTLPTGVVYTAAENKATLTFAAIPNGTFKLKAGVSNEANDTLAQAVHVAGPTTLNSQYLGDNPALTGVASKNDVDLYRFDVRVAGPLTASVTGSANFDALLRVFDSAGAEIGVVNATGAGGAETITTASLMPGTYYVGVSSSGNAVYNPVAGTGATGGSSQGSYNLTVAFANNAPIENGGNDSSYATAGNIGTLGLGGQKISASIDPQPYSIILPGIGDEPGHRNLPPPPTGEEHLLGAPDSTPGIPVLPYNFQDVYGVNPQGLDLHNAITENQKQRAREIFELYGRYLGVKFVETPGAGITVATGDLRAADPTIPTGPGGVAGLGGPGLVVMDNAENWGNSEYGGNWFQVAMHEIGHAIGLGHSYDLPPLTIQGSAETPVQDIGNTPAEPVFPGDADILHGQALYRPDIRDIDLYKFQVTEAGRFTAETIAERLTNSSLLNTVLSLYRETTSPSGVVSRELISRNDDYFSSDSFIDMTLQPGVYYIGVTASGTTGVDPSVLNSALGGLSDGLYDLKLNFTPAVETSMVDATGTKFDGDLDGRAGGAYEFFFRSNVNVNGNPSDADPALQRNIVYVDKANTRPNGPDRGTLANPFTKIKDAVDWVNNFLADPSDPANADREFIIRIVGNGGIDGNVMTLADNLPYLVGYTDINDPLADGADLLVPRNATLMIDAGVNIKFQRANIDAGTSAVNVDRGGGVIQVLGTPSLNVYLTSYHNDLIGGDTDGPAVEARPGDWGGLVFRADSDYEDNNIFLNYVNHADLTFGGGKLVVNSIEEVFTPIHLVTARPTLTFNKITQSADAAISADPDSFEDSLGTVSNVSQVLSRIGPKVYGNVVTDNSVNGLFIRIRTEFGSPVDVLTKFARFDDTDIVHVITENLHINGTPGGPVESGGVRMARLDARLKVDPGVIVKLEGARIETRIGAQLIAEGSDSLPVIFTSRKDDRFGAGGTFDTTNDSSSAAAEPGQWGGLVFDPNSIGSIDRAMVLYAGGITPIEGSFAGFSPVEIDQADVRIANTLFQFNDDGHQPPLATGNRNGRGTNGSATIFVRGAQPTIIDNVIRDNAGNAISVNANAFVAVIIPDYGRSTGDIDRYSLLDDNFGPLVRLNRMVGNETSGMEVRGAVLTTESIWDDTDIAHVLRDRITILNQHVFGGLRIQSSPRESLVVKLSGQDAGFLADGVAMDIIDRIGGTLHIVGQPNRPVVLTSLADDTVSAGLQPITDLPLFDTNGDGTATTAQPGDWNSIRLDRYSNDRNAAILLETESAFIGSANNANGVPNGDQNRIPLTTAQFIGNLAPNEKSGDENRRLGFEIQGFIALDNPHDVDVYSFTADPNTEVWFDIDRSGYGLNAMLELVDANGNVIATSFDEANLSGSALTYQKDPYLGRDFYAYNPYDPIMRVILPGVAKGSTYFIRVRSEPNATDYATPNKGLNAGQTRGDYRLYVRVNQVDDKAGSTVRYADIRYATNGVEVIGLPLHSNIGGESTEAESSPGNSITNNSFGSAQYLGNLLTSDRATVSVAGNLASSSDVDFFSFDLDYDFLQVIGGVSDAAKTIATMFDIDYADGISRPDTTISIFDQNGRLIFVGRDSDIEDDQPGVGQGLDSDDLSRATFGKLDPYIGAVQMPAGSVGAAQTRRYYVAISSNRQLPRALDAYFQAGAASPLIRLEPVNSVRRIVEDHIGSQNGSGLAQGAGSPMFNIQNVQTLKTHVAEFTFDDTVLFTTAGDGVRQVNGATGALQVDEYGGSSDIRDIVMRNDGRLFGYRYRNNDNGNAGELVELNPATNSWVSRGTDGIANPPQGNTDPDLINAPDVGALAFTGVGYIANNYQLYYAVTTTSPLDGSRFSYLYRADPNDGHVRDGTGPLGRRGTAITAATSSSGTANFGVSSLTFVSNVAGATGDNIQINITHADRGFGQPPAVFVTGPAATPTINIELNTAVSSAQAGLTVNGATLQFVADAPGPQGNNIQLVITKAANVPNGANVTTNGRTINIVLDNANVTVDQFITAINNNAGAAALINVTQTSGTGGINISGVAAGTISLSGGTPTSAQDVINAIIQEPTANALVSVTANGNTTAPIAVVGGPTQTFNLTGGSGTISETTGLAYLDGTMYGVSADGGFFIVGLGGGATTITNFPGVSFTGLTVGPQNVEGGRYSNLLFASTTGGGIMAFDTNGVLQPIFAPTPSEPAGATRISTPGLVGLAFSPLDFNLWHTTQFRRFEDGHGINAAPDNSRGSSDALTSFYFGLENWTSGSSNTSYNKHGGVNGGGNAQLGVMESEFQRNLTSNAVIGNNYNILGYARGALTTDSFSLQGYKSTDKPTVYFNYWLDTENRNSNNGNMRDSARVWISKDDGVTWELIATNNSVLDNPTTFAREGELTTFVSTSTTELPGNERQDIQELFDVASWRQARIDLSDYAGQPNLKFRFDFSTSGVTNAPTVDGFEDTFGDESSPQRSADNDHGGFMIDDIIVGFAERGEMATSGSANLADFFPTPVPRAPAHLAPTPSEVLAGTYQLEIRRGADYGVNEDGARAGIGLYQNFDTNSRLILDTREAPPLPVADFQTGTFGALPWLQRDDAPWTVVESPAGSGQFRAESGGIDNDRASTLELTATVGAGTISFDWGVSSEANFDVLNFYIDGVLADSIDGNTPTSNVSYGISAGTHIFRWSYIKDGSIVVGLDRGWIDNVTFSNGAQVGAGVIGDDNHFRDQGQILIEKNLITDSLQVGILVDAAARLAQNNLPFPGAAQIMAVPNNQALLPGVVLMNNVVGNYGSAGIRFSGDPNQVNQPKAATSFGRIVNNTVYGGATPQGIGIDVTDFAGPTIMNNIVANSATGISIDASSLTNTVVGANLYANNLTNGNVGNDSTSIQLQPGDPLFVNPANRNFYLATGSKAIDSALNTLGERPSMNAVKAPLAIPDSPILAPDQDLFGQKRLDDPSQNPPPGLGSNIFKDRGGLERADFFGPTATLIDPVDLVDPLDPDSTVPLRDRDGRRNKVIITNEDVHRFIIKLLDNGIGIDDLGILESQFTITQDGVLMTGGGVDYTFIYNANTDEVTFIPNSGAWEPEKTYVINIDRSVATGVKDVAGNSLLANESDGTTQFTIFVGTLVDYGDLPDPYPTTEAEDGPRHTIVDGFYLGDGVTPDTDGQHSPLADADTKDDGLVFAQLQALGGAGNDSKVIINSSADAKLDMWIDLNHDGDFDDENEKISPPESFTLVPGDNTFEFDLPDGAGRGDTAVRFRMSSAGTPLPTGPAPDGEVEDYIINVSGPIFQNPSGAPDSQHDVNNDGFISAIDALIVINYLNILPAGSTGALPIAGILDQPPPYVDVNGDGFLSAQDALNVINYLNTHPIGGAGEGEGEGEGVPATELITTAAAPIAATSDTSSSDGSNIAIPGTLYASSSVVVEVRHEEPDSVQVADHLFATDELFGADPIAVSNRGVETRDNSESSLDDDELGDLFAALALDGDDSDDAIFG